MLTSYHRPLTFTYLFLLSLKFNAPVVSAGLIKCRRENGPIPLALRCDDYPNAGNAKELDNQPSDQLNTAVNSETSVMTSARLNNGGATTGTASRTFTNLFGSLQVNDNARFFFRNNDDEAYDPVFDAYCFNEDYPVPSFSSIDDQNELYLDYKAVFDDAFEDNEDQNADGVTQNRIPGMFLRMCFHDNTIDIEETNIDFRKYVANAIDPESNKWTSESRFMITSGADASNLICPEERTHPNNNLDSSATRVLTRIQRTATLKEKHPDMSYADLLHNGCNAATIYLTNTDPTTALTMNPFTFGRKDACHVDQRCGKKYALCGPSELLPGQNLNVTAASDWFTLRGMSLCSMMAMMWTHTTVEDMAFLCPIQKIICTATQDDVEDVDAQDLYFKANDQLDYFDFFLNRGTHRPGRGCTWTVDGNNVPWPMTRIDCTFGLSNVENVTGSSSELANVIKNFVHNSTQYDRYDSLQCALNILAGTGNGTLDNSGNACAQVLPTECRSQNRHLFGSYFSTLPATDTPRETVDPKCGRFGYRRRHLSSAATADPTEHMMETYPDCVDALYDMYLVIDGVHFVMVTMPVADRDNHQTFCPPLIIHSVYDDTDDQLLEKVMVVLPSDIDYMNDDMKFHLGIRTLDKIIESYDSAHVGYESNESYTTIYHPITNNCVALLQNMAMSLNIPLRENVPLQEFITNRLLSSLSSNSEDRHETNDLLERMMEEYENEDDDGELHRLLSMPSSTTATTNSANEMISKVMEYYLS